MDAAETDAHQAHEVARPAPLREPEALEHVFDERPSLERLASNIGNRAFGQVVARMRDGDGILAGGLVHPDVQAAIGASRGLGRALDRNVASALSSSFGEPLDHVRVHTGASAAALARAVDARAFTVGNDIYFGHGEYRPGTSEGKRLIAHEAVHTLQQRGAPEEGPLMVSQPGDAPEREADAAARHAIG